MPTNADWLFVARERSRELAHQLVRLEQLADDYERHGDYTRADAVRYDRDSLRQERSLLMRDIWRKRRVTTPRRGVTP